MDIFTLLYNDHKLYKKCIDMNTSKIGLTDQYNIITERSCSKGERSYCEDTDIDRIWHMQKNSNLIYLDADTIIDKLPDFELEKGFVYCGFSGDIVDTWAYIGNGVQWFFDFLMGYVDYCGGNPEPLWSHRLLGSILAPHIKRIPDGYFRHLALHQAAITCEKKIGKHIAGRGYSCCYENGEWILELGKF